MKRDDEKVYEGIMGEFIKYVIEITPWFEADGVYTDNEIFSMEVKEHTKSLHEIGVKIHAEYGMEGLYAAHNFADKIRCMGRFVEIAFNGIDMWRS